MGKRSEPTTATLRERTLAAYAAAERNLKMAEALGDYRRANAAIRDLERLGAEIRRYKTRNNAYRT